MSLLNVCMYVCMHTHICWQTLVSDSLYKGGMNLHVCMHVSLCMYVCMHAKYV